MFNDSYFGATVSRLLGLGLILSLGIAGLLPIYWLVEPGRQAAEAAEMTKVDLRHGRELYIENCVPCHGTRGEGGVGPALNNKGLLTKASDEVLFDTIRIGRPNTLMNAWGQEHGGQLTAEDIRQIVAFIRAWEPNAPEIAADTFEPSAARGAAIFASTCFVCHGEDGQGGLAPALNDPAQLSSHDDEWYRQTIVNGRPAKGMPIWGKGLTPNQIEDLVALTAAWRKGESVTPDVTVAELLDATLFTLEQGDADNTLFYLRRARLFAFGPALDRFDQTIALLEANDLDQALVTLTELREQWPIGDAEQGAEIFADACKGCHGSEGQGGVGPRLKPNDFIQANTNADLLSLLFTGRPGTAMRSFSGQLSESQLANVIAFLRTWQP